METDQLQSLLHELRFTADFPDEVLTSLAEASSFRSVALGEVLFREGSPNDRLYLVCSGRLALEMNVPPRGAVRILTLGPGEMVGWSAVIGEGKMTASAVAIDETELVVAPAETLRELCEVNHDFGYYLMREMAAALARRLVVTRLQLLDLFGDVPASVPMRTVPKSTTERAT